MRGELVAVGMGAVVAAAIEAGPADGGAQAHASFFLAETGLFGVSANKKSGKSGKDLRLRR